MENVTARWSSEEKQMLKSVSFSLKSGELGVIIGPVGSGKVNHKLKALKNDP